ncbi:YggT family protein [Robiginitomaculum antarcticum]|uniref:YggT family protein n=1 Tax=Robiginitomaculum antarcticum TaxID=437507 RepID=UPI00036A4F2E|nr:YggT family protein [Robiginitomaculum antarcticum]
MLSAILTTLHYILTLYLFVMIAMIVMSWLKAFGLVNARNPIVAQIDQVLYALTEPVLRPIRNILPRTGMLDLSPIVVFVVIIFLQSLIQNFLIGQYL